MLAMLAGVNTVLYGSTMAERLSRQDWIDAGLRALARDGFTALKADVLAKRLGVSRGSFYWHFADLAAFHKAVIGHWRAIATQAVIAEIEPAGGPAGRLRALLRRAFAESPRLEFAMRAWAAADARAARGIAAIDRQRLGYLRNLLETAGIEPGRAASRAQLLYWTFLGYVSQRPDDALRPQQILDELQVLVLPDK
jgi:AcrR family transcriptional regulator